MKRNVLVSNSENPLVTTYSTAGEVRSRGLMVLFYLLLPQQVEVDWSWQSLMIAATM